MQIVAAALDGNLFCYFKAGFSLGAEGQVMAVKAHGYGAFDDADEFAGEVVKGLFKACLCLIACRSHDGFMVFKRNGVKQDVIHIRVGGAQQRLAAARAFGKVQPHDGQAAEVFSSPRHQGLEHGRQHEG